MQRDTISFFLCGTGVEEIKSGKYKFNIEAFIGKDYYKLYWSEHKLNIKKPTANTRI
ncbi:hypothetical protein D3C85_1633990 [compost metagenome]